MSSSTHTPGAALVAEAADADPVTRLVLGWLAGKRSENTRTAYARDIGITPRRRAGHAPSWLAWCRAEGVHPVTGVTGLHVALYARHLAAAAKARCRPVWGGCYDLKPPERFVAGIGWVAERLKAPVLKTGRGASPSWVRIPPHPPATQIRHPRKPVLMWSKEVRRALAKGTAATR